jgi:hypothetical protein
MMMESDWDDWEPLVDPLRIDELGISFPSIVSGWTVEVWLTGVLDQTSVSEVRFVAGEGERSAAESNLGPELRNLGLSRLRQNAIRAAQHVLADSPIDVGQFRIPELDQQRAKAFAEGLRAVRPLSLHLGAYDRTDDLFLAYLATRYVELSLETSAVVPALVKEFGRATDTMRDLLRAARKRGLLSDPPSPGRAGGHLLPEAIRILESAAND